MVNDGQGAAPRDGTNGTASGPRLSAAGARGPEAEADRQERELELAPGVTMAFVHVPAGTFLMGAAADDELAFDDEKPQHEVYLDAFWIGREPVTVRQFEAFVAATGHDAGLRWRRAAVGKPDHPVVRVRWYDAVVFCAWACGVTGQTVMLPTEAQWEKAARGTDGRRYPWGNEAPDESRCNFNRNVGGTTPVGGYPAGASPYGALDMAGNVFEWVADWYGKDYYTMSPREDPLGAECESRRVLRGGSWNLGARNVRASYRSLARPAYRARIVNLGFRCALL